MQIKINPGTYVVAVSGGVDSMVLLDMLRHQPNLTLIVAHYDHGIRDDSALDRRLVQAVARQHGLSVVYQEGHLGAGVSEAYARQVRYQFLHAVKSAAQARAIITAHHQDDLIETAIFNILRGTGRHGLTALGSTDTVLRPLLHMPKSELIRYARANNLAWREDSTNQDVRYVRNYIRHRVIPKFKPEDRQAFLDLIEKTELLNQEIDDHLLVHLHVQPALDQLERHHFIMLPHKVSLELLAAWLRRHNIRNFDTKTLLRLTVAAKTYKPGRTADIDAAHLLRINKDNLALHMRDR